MERINPFFIIGTTGIFVTASLHVILAAFFSEAVISGTSSVLYAVFILLLLIGTAIMANNKKRLQKK